MAARVLIALLFFIGLGSLISGAMLFLAPDGRLMHWSTAELAGTPFSNYVIPGIILFVFLGIFPIVVGYGLLRQPTWVWPNVLNPSKKRHWAWTASWAAGVIMLIWITVELLLLGYISLLQPIAALYGIVIVALTLLPNIRMYYTR
jgi:hypothetical protein